MNLSLHRCKVCGCRWLLWPDVIHGGGWNLLDKYSKPGACCDNAPMGDQIEHLRDIPLQISAHGSREAELRSALQRIADDPNADCRCEHDDENCCANVTDYCCPYCIAVVALRAAHGSEQEGPT